MDIVSQMGSLKAEFSKTLHIAQKTPVPGFLFNQIARLQSSYFFCIFCIIFKNTCFTGKTLGSASDLGELMQTTDTSDIWWKVSKYFGWHITQTIRKWSLLYLFLTHLRCMYDTVKLLCWSFITKIISDLKLLVINEVCRKAPS